MKKGGYLVGCRESGPQRTGCGAASAAGLGNPLTSASDHHHEDDDKILTIMTIIMIMMSLAMMTMMMISDDNDCEDYNRNPKQVSAHKSLGLGILGGPNR